MEVWRPVLGYADCYEVSDRGSVRRISTRSGKPTCKPCKPTHSRGYVKFVLSRSGVTQTITAHKLVWEAFNGPRPSTLQINHKNGDKADNRISNLELCTQSENTAHAFRVLKVPPNINPNHGTKNGRAKLGDADVANIKRCYVSGESQQSIADRYGVNQTTVSRIVRGAGWKITNPQRLRSTR